MLFIRFNPRVSALIRLIGLGLVVWSVVDASHHRAGQSGRGLAVTIALVIAAASWLWWVAVADLDTPVRLDTYLLALSGGVLLGASPDSAASACVFVAIVAGALRTDLTRAWTVVALGSLGLAVSVIIWDETALGLLAYVLGFAAAALAASNVRQFRERADEAELLLAQTQRSQEEGLRAARLEESTRIAREIHDVLAHSLAGLSIQLEATTALIENGAAPDEVLARVRRAHELARDGLRETRRAVGALRGEAVSVPDALQALAGTESATFALSGDERRLAGELGQAVLRVVQESLTNIAKHAPGSAVRIAIDVGAETVVTVDSGAPGVPVTAGPLAATGGGYGITGMRERAQALGGTLEAGPTEAGWRVRLSVPSGSGSAAVGVAAER